MVLRTAGTWPRTKTLYCYPVPLSEWSTPVSATPTDSQASRCGTISRTLPCGDYGIVLDNELVAAVERKALPDLVSSLSGAGCATT